MKSLLGVILVGLFIFGHAEVSGQEKYLCVAERSTGFAYKEISKSWENTILKQMPNI